MTGVTYEPRWGDEWKPGDRVRVFDHYHEPGAVRDGTIRDRSWGRDRGKPIWRFTVDLDDFPGEGWVFEPGQLNAPGVPDSTE
jgi:hypothetical protein